MIQSLCRSFSVAVVLSVAGLPLAASAEQTPGNAHANLQETLAVVVEQPDAETGAGVPAEQEAARLTPATDELSDHFRITDHTHEGQRVAVLRINHMPVLAFLEASETVVAKAEATAIAAEDTLTQRAASVAQHLDAFEQAGGDPEAIGVRWDADLEEYAITLEGEQLVLINDATHYANPTGQRQADALQAANRLRSLLGAATHLTEVEGAPEPEPTAIAATRSTGEIVSAFTGRASWYGPGFHGNHTASGEVFNQNALTAAHRTLPFGTRVRVTNVNNNRYVVVRINDRGPFSRGRVIDLSAGAAREIGLHRAGVGTVRVEVLTD